MAKMKLTTAEWLEHVASQVNSECSQRAYCSEHNLSLSTFCYWKKRYVKLETSENQELVEVAPRSVGAWMHDLCTISFPNGCTVRLRTANAIGLISALAKEFGQS